ncbi:alpha/beta hydrolase [Herbidospora sp. NBRC 101105]|uniref:alpha/beta fold hydrolase n=1 Tax=Herbidospora sp. NBRC 101105 TaxID=3032195 RepID=UPI0024A0409A|nr:alpha/beta hydrolase [Herbidospora sp. NBRC 101105]GLX99436.1 hydrolase [Herbidospora sp. NBRC 101105]
MFEGFTLDRVQLSEVALRVRYGGSGPAVLLIHGHPRTHTTWHRLAPLLAENHTVVCPDLRGYSQSSKPETTPDHGPYSKRAMAADCLELMRALGHETFRVVGHDRGGYVAFRLALDHPDAVAHLTALDVVPIGEALARCDANFATRWWHWFFRAQPAPGPETVIGNNLSLWYQDGPDQMGQDSWEDLQRALGDPRTIHAMCEDYRAGLGIDRRHDDTDREAGRRVRCPTLVLWGTRGDLPQIYPDIPAVWRAWIDADLMARGIDSDHHIAEDAPAELHDQLLTAWKNLDIG